MAHLTLFKQRLLLAVTFFSAALFASCATKETAVVPEPYQAPVPVVVEAPPEKPDEPVEPLINMILIPGGNFRMGSERERNERPVHTVTVNSFLLGKYEVTQGEYFAITGERPGNFRTNRDDEGPDGWKKLPVEQVSWYHALVFCNRLSIREGLDPVYRIRGSVFPDRWGEIPEGGNRDWNTVEKISDANGYRLPTEAEWEFAARGGNSSRNFNFAGSNNSGDVAWFFDNSDMRVREVGRKNPNELGLYDMSGNVMEWCWDWFGPYTSGAKDNPVGPPINPDPVQVQFRVIRGGSYSGAVVFCRVTYRHHNLPSFIATNLGFRVARNEPGDTE